MRSLSIVVVLEPRTDSGSPRDYEIPRIVLLCTLPIYSIHLTIYLWSWGHLHHDFTFPPFAPVSIKLLTNTVFLLGLPSHWFVSEFWRTVSKNLKFIFTYLLPTISRLSNTTYQFKSECVQCCMSYWHYYCSVAYCDLSCCNSLLIMSSFRKI